MINLSPKLSDSKADSLVLFPDFINISNSVKQTLATGILSFDIIYSNCISSTISFQLKQLISCNVFKWISLFERSNFQSLFNEHFQGSRSIYGSNYNTSGKPVFSVFASIMGIFRIIFVDRPISYSSLQFLLSKYGYTSINSGEFRISPFEFMILQLGALSSGIVNSSNYITNFLNIQIECSWNNPIFKTENLLNKEILVASGISYSVAERISTLLSGCLNKEKETHSFVEILQALTPEMLQPYITQWSSFTNSSNNHNLNPIILTMNSLSSSVSTLALSAITEFSFLQFSNIQFGFMPNTQNLPNYSKLLILAILETKTSISTFSSESFLMPSNLFLSLDENVFKTLKQSTFTIVGLSTIFGFSEIIKPGITRNLEDSSLSTQDRKNKRNSFRKTVTTSRGKIPVPNLPRTDGYLEEPNLPEMNPPTVPRISPEFPSEHRQVGNSISVDQFNAFRSEVSQNLNLLASNIAKITNLIGKQSDKRLAFASTSSHK